VRHILVARARAVSSLYAKIPRFLYYILFLGARMGVSEHTDDNHRVFQITLSRTDTELIQSVLDQSKGCCLISTIGDCGAEYR
jgi:hypothetical protein